MDWLLGLAGVIFGGGVSWLVFFRQSKSKADGEAKQAQAQAQQQAALAAQEWLAVYERALSQAEKKDKENEAYIDELRQDRLNLRQDRDELRKLNDEMRKKIAELTEKVLQLERDVARNGRMVEALRPFLCGKLDCPNRVRVVTEQQPKGRKKTAIE